MKAEEQKLPKHHYIPVFYLNEWTRPDGRLTEFSRPTGGDVVPRNTSPKGTGYVRGLYRINHLTGDAAEAFERLFFAMVDNLAKDSLDILLGRKKIAFTGKARSAWSRFVLGMLFRNPERIAHTRKYIEDFLLQSFDQDVIAYDAQKAESDPDYLEYLSRNASYLAVDWTKNMLQRETLGLHLNNMRWSVRRVDGAGLTLFTSDRPVVMTNGLIHDWANLVMPLSPVHAFIATNSQATMDQITTMPVIKGCNTKVLRYAQKYAWSNSNLMINAANRNLAAESEVSRSFFDAPPIRRSDS